MFQHEDDRRLLIEYAVGDFKTAKALIAKKNCVVGNHYHLKKDEHFLLISGVVTLFIKYPPNCEEPTDFIIVRDIEAPAEFSVPRGWYHRFELEKGSILIGVATEEFDPDDEIAGHPNTKADYYEKSNC